MSSGGIVSCILLDLLARGQIDGALVSRITTVAGHMGAVTTLARTREEILQCGGSSYIDTPVLQKFNEIKDTPGRYAVVCLPCQARTLHNQLERNPELREKFPVVIGLFCRGNVTATFYDDYFARIGIDTAQVESVRVKRGHLQGDVIVSLKNGGERTIPFMKINTYRLAGIHPKALCAWCDEHMSASADIAVGDIFTPEFKQRPIKHSAFIPHSPEAVSLLQDLETRGVLTAEFVGMQQYRQAFARIERFSDTLASRYPAARFTGQVVPRQPKPGRSNFFHVLAWIIMFQNKKLSQSEKGRRFLFSLPAPVVQAMAFLAKALSRL